MRLKRETYPADQLVSLTGMDPENPSLIKTNRSNSLMGTKESVSASPLRLPFVLLILFLSFFLLPTSTLQAQDTIFLKGDTIRVGELEWDMEKDYESKGVIISQNEELYGENVRIFLEYHSNREVSQIVFGYIEQEAFIPHGPARYYYPSGHLLGKRYFNEGLLVGKAEDYYKDGTVQMRSYFENDTLHGAYETFHEDGKPNMKGSFLKGLFFGALRSYYETGKPEFIEYYDSAGVKQGWDTTFYETGTLESEFHFKNGIEDSTARFYHRNGRIWSERFYVDGRLQTVSFIKDKKGKELEIGNFDNGFGWLFIYNDDGILQSRSKYRYGLLKKTKPVKK